MQGYLSITVLAQRERGREIDTRPLPMPTPLSKLNPVAQIYGEIERETKRA
jgi:hypothetical protein